MKTAKPRPTRATVLRARQLRQEQTPAEKKIWQRVRNHQLNNLPIRRQHPIGPYVVDFCCEPPKVVIEIDGDSHFETEQMQFDQERTDWLKTSGYRVIRFTNDEVHHNFEAVLQSIADVCETKS
jgi:very-short-patch-repair endonuclease